MKYVAMLTIVDPVGNTRVRPAHLAYLEMLRAQGKVTLAGPFTDGQGGMVMYEAASFEEANQYASEDPVVKEGVRTLELREWKPLW